jgi:hypothetical protein
MNVEIRTEATQFLFWEDINSNFLAMQTDSASYYPLENLVILHL